MECILALLIRKIFKTPLSREHFKKAGRYLPELEEAFVRTSFTLPKDDFLCKELSFLGWVKLSEYTKFERKNKKYGFFITNRKINGDYWIYPYPYADNSDNQKELFYERFMGLNGIPGITKYKYSKYDGKIKRT